MSGILRLARRTPVTCLYLACLIAAASVVGPVLGRHGAVRALVGTGFDSLVVHGRWWTPLTSVVFTDGVGGLAVALVVVGVLVGAAEYLMGSWRTIVAVVVSAYAGPATGIALQAAGWGDVSWVRHLIDAGSLDATRPALGAVMAASAFAGTLWRRRIRVVVLLVTMVFVLYSGHPADLYRLGAVVAGFLLGRVLRPRVRLVSWVRSSHREIRVLMASAVAITAIGPVIAVLSSTRFGLLAPMAMLAGEDVGPAAGHPHCDVLAVTSRCVQGFALDRMRHGGVVVGAAVPMVVLLIAAQYLLRGRRAALWTAVGLNGALALWSVVHFGFLPLLGHGLLDAGTLVHAPSPAVLHALHLHRPDLRYWRTDLALIASTATPAATAVALIVFRRHFAVPTRRRGSGALVAASGVVSESVRVRELLARGGGSLSHMAAWSGNSYWFGDGGDVAIAFRVINSVAVTVVGPFGDAAHHEAALAAFARHCDDNGWHPVFYSVDAGFERRFRAMGWKTVTVAEESVIDVSAWTVSGRRRQALRTAVNKARRTGVVAVWTDYRSLPLADQLQIADLSEQWLSEKNLPEMSFTLGGLTELDDPDVRLMLARGPDGVIVAVTSWLPVHRDGVVVGYTLDVMRRRAGSPNGVMEFVIVSAVERAREAGLATVSLSGAPLARSAPRESATQLDRALDVISGILEPRYGFSSLARFKDKFGPEHRALIMAYPDPALLGRIGLALLRAYLPTLSAGRAMRMLRSR